MPSVQGKATLWGHPIHPMLVPFPIAFFVGSLIADFAYFYTDNDFWTTVGTVLIAMGIVGALAAAIFGLLDYLSAPMATQVKRVATTHLILNLVLVALYVVNFLVRRSTPEAALGYLLSVIGIGVLFFSGWLGGALAYEHRVGVKPSAEETMGRSAVTRHTAAP
jgi:uncharacterized membrane protein